MKPEAVINIIASGAIQKSLFSFPCDNNFFPSHCRVHVAVERHVTCILARNCCTTVAMGGNVKFNNSH